MRPLSQAYLGLVLAFLYLPILVMVAMAFNRSALYELPFTFDLVWFRELAGNQRLLAASWNSVWIAACNAVIATFLGTLAAIAFARYTWRGKQLMQLLLFPPITIPWLIIGTSMSSRFINRCLPSQYVWSHSRGVRLTRPSGVPAGPEKESPVPVMITTRLSGSLPTSRNASGNSPCGRLPHCRGPPWVWNVI